MLQPLDGEVNDKTKHKFMVQSMFAAEDAEDVELLVCFLLFRFTLMIYFYLNTSLCTSQIYLCCTFCTIF